MASKGSNDENWVLNISAMHHIINDSSNLGNLISYNGQVCIFVGKRVSYLNSSIGYMVVLIQYESLHLSNVVLHAIKVVSRTFI